MDIEQDLSPSVLQRLVKNRRINHAINFLESSCADDVNLAEVADIACLSKYHFLRVFNETVGETPISFLQRIRLERSARKLVYVRTAPIGDVAYDCGFASAQSFSTAFARRFGSTPREYRNSNVFKFNEYWIGRDPVPISDIDIELGNDRKFVMPKFAIETRPECRVAYIRFVGPYIDGGDASFYSGGVCPKFEQLRSWARRNNLLRRDSEIISISWDNPNVTPGNRCRLDVCLPVGEDVLPDSLVSIQTIPGGTYAVMYVGGEDMDIRHGWEYFLMHWLPDARYVPSFDVGYEVYAPSDDGREHFCRGFYLPVRRA